MADVTETRHGHDDEREARSTPGVVPIFCETTEALPEPRALSPVCRIGRDGPVELRLDDSQVSREHAELASSSRGVVVTDLGSRNGTWVDGQRVVTPATPVPLDGVVRCGKTLLSVVADVERFRRHPPVRETPLVGGGALAEVRELVRTMGPTPHPVFIFGETGTGKERVAEALHLSSGRTGAFVAINCSALPATLVESELFGHARGAFSGSREARAGMFRAAHGGTLFLDEIGELPLEAQAKLLRVLETGEVRAVGEDRATVVDVRVVSATNANLDEMVRAGRFRADLLHRIGVWQVVLPPLRERRQDVPLLATHFLSPGSPRFSVEAMERLVLAAWPGNVRQLRNVVLTSSTHAQAQNAPLVLERHLPRDLAVEGPASFVDPDLELRTRLDTALTLREGNVAHVARDLGMRRALLYDHLKRLNLDPNSYRKR